MVDLEEYLRSILESYDKTPKESADERRASAKFLWDYFMKLLLVVGTNHVGYDIESLKIAHLKTRWNQINRPLSTIDQIEKWNQLINKINCIREKIEHDDFFSPDGQDLVDIRQQAPLFKEWILKAGVRYYRSSKGFNFIDYFKRITDFYLSQSEIILSNYGLETPYVAKYVYAPIVKDDIYSEIPSLKKIIEKRIKEIHRITDLDHSDLEKLTKFIEVISKINAWEDALLKDSICPACGGHIKETQRYSGGGYEEPPDTVHIRVGCTNCKYEIMTDTIDI